MVSALIINCDAYEREEQYGGPFKTFASFDYASLYPHTFSSIEKQVRMLGVKLNRKVKAQHLWDISDKNTND